MKRVRDYFAILAWFNKIFPLKSTHLHQENEAELLEPTTAVPPEFNRNISFKIYAFTPGK